MSETGLTTLDYALLGLLDLAPMSGYDISGIFASTPLAHFSASPGTVYPALKRLERLAMATTALDKTREARPRRVYTLTDDGRAALETWLRQPVTRQEIEQNGSISLLRFALMEKHVSPEEAIAYVRGFRQQVQNHIDELSDFRQQAEGSQTLHQRLAMDCGLRGFMGLREWADAAIHALETALDVQDRQ